MSKVILISEVRLFSAKYYVQGVQLGFSAFRMLQSGQKHLNLYENKFVTNSTLTDLTFASDKRNYRPSLIC
jgi:hypothetical protein